MPGPLYLLGPQRPAPNMPKALATLSGSGRVVYVTAGWRLDENDDDALRDDVGIDGFSLPLYAWFEELAKEAPDLFAAHHAQQDTIRTLKSLYRLRLDPAIESVRLLLAQRALGRSSAFVEEELEDALRSLRGMRERFIRHCDEARARFGEEWKPLQHPSVARRRDEIEALLSEARAVLIAGGHVGVLRNRLEFFGMDQLLLRALDSGVGVIAWSAGAMSLAEQVVLFHDDPPTGQSNAEVLDRGLGLASELVVLPHARERLFLDDPARVALMACRFDPIPCIGLENGAWLERREGTWINRGDEDAAFRLQKDGRVTPLERLDA
jgi:peptidase E